MDSKIMSLFEPIQIGSVTSKNRIVMPPMNANMAFGDGFASERNRDYYAERARGGAGVIILEALFIEWAAKHRTYGMGASEDKYIPGLRMVAEGIQEHGTLAVAQINHNGRILSEDATGLQTVAPSTYSNPATGEVSVEFTAEEIQELVDKYANAARRIKEAGFDAVEVHGAHGYLLAQFLSPFTNKRTDQYGGSLENRMRLPLQVLRKVKKVCGDDYPVFYRLSAEELFQGGLELAESTLFARRLEGAGVDLLDVSGSSLEQPHKLAKLIPCNYYPHGSFMASAAAMKKVVSIPVVGVGRINCPVMAARFLDEGKADMVAVGRQFLADPHWPNKALEGRYEDIIRCIACNTGCLDVLLKNKTHITCVLNPAVGREKEYEIKPAKEKRKVAIIGAGPAGLEAARVASLRGHEVSIYEKQSMIGGQLNLACKAPGKEEIQYIIDYYQNQIVKLQIDLNLETDATTQLFDEIRPDVVILATGGKPKMIDEEWADAANVVSAWEVLAETREMGPKVVIVGGGRIGLETAEFLEKTGHEVIVVEKLNRIGSDMGLTVRPAIMNRLIRSSINVFNKAEVKAVSGKDVTIDRDGDIITLRDVDSIVISVGVEPNRVLQKELKKGSFKVHVIGNCSREGAIMEAVADGAEVGRRV